jgi:hypothetical protein
MDGVDGNELAAHRHAVSGRDIVSRREMVGRASIEVSKG